ncbi:hypothetical protein HZS55_04405 [Halosimplex rubrum]|uniref:DUF3267 domain-containing protein n=1 Tax=Halosimplex rubrum TaxID=869889 RepID=A0A7D5TKF7_9EURY|nr:hypothetical protein [Halosimplex rubrum]QLH76592.1 hypothetical protein HZS55_04405 [Halosimplex rubrum]
MSDVLLYALAVPAAVVGIVVALFLHEAAHAAPVLLAGGSSHISVGSDSGRTARFGPLTVTVGFDGVRKLVAYGYHEWEGTHSKRVRTASIAAGPAMTVLIVAALGPVMFRDGTTPISFCLRAIFYSEFFRAVQTIVPRTYSRGAYAGLDSDGKQFLRLVRS